MSPETPRSSLFKSRFSILSLLPSRHPPLHINHYPMPRKYEVSRHPTTIISASGISPVHSEYPDPSTPLPPLPLPPRHYDNFQEEGKSNGKGRQSPNNKRPPPLNLEKTRMMYPPNHTDVIVDPGTGRSDGDYRDNDRREIPPLPSQENVPSIHPKYMSKPKVVERSSTSQVKSIKKTTIDDPFEIAEVESGHRYPSWKGGKVDIRPGQVIPRDLIPSFVSQNHNSANIPASVPSTRRKTTAEDEDSNDDDYYESVLHNVLLTPTYFGHSPLSIRTPTISPGGCSASKFNKRRTLLDKATDTVYGAARGARNSRWLPGKSILRPSAALEADQSLRAMKEREEQEMERFRRNVRPVRLNVPDHDEVKGNMNSTWSISSSSSPIRESNNVYSRRSPGWIGAREHSVGSGYEGQKSKSQSSDNGWRQSRAEEEKSKRKQKIWKYSIILAIFILSALIIGLCTTLLRKGSSGSSTSSSSNSTEMTSTLSTSAAVPTATSYETLTTCLDQFRILKSPSTYPCSDCVPLLSTTTNDFSTPLVDGNSTGVGSALQFCALMDIYKKTSLTEGMSGWMKDSSPCGGWNGISCDSRGRITGLLLQYPNVPHELPDTLSNIWALEGIHIMGNSTVPTGKFPSSLLSSTNIQIIDLEYTALQGPIDGLSFTTANALTTLVLVNNPNLGNALPDLSNNDKLLTLAVTGQGLSDAKVDRLPSGITYLDLSYNSLSGQIPSFNQLNSLNTLYLQNNIFTSSPDSLPTSIVSISLTSNTDLSGSMPSLFCSSSILDNCDLRNTKLIGTASSLGSTNTISSSNANSDTIATAVSSSTLIPTSTSDAVSSTAAQVSSATSSTVTSATSSTTGTSSMISLVGREPAGCGICKFT
ncbi:uncharacterized protein IL334_007028 [Kwoniella shivajii]|uniref:Leucine-rich repeat-containing N-terminal plant-type domain-containing protein n=1 Tax=Kwoniella shivajii TaxID=564305 RepID=A0ABZ1D807_9TREE|nr:hypothetical protein IL334_007028 [Kwoniella shivajii]